MRNIISAPVLLLIAQYVHNSLGNHACVCVDSQDVPVYKERSSTADVIGYMYEFDCAALLDPSSVNDWRTVFYSIQFHGETGYIENNPPGIQIDNCPGPGPVVVHTTTNKPTSPPPTTIMTTPTTPTTFMTTTPPTTTAFMTTTTPPTTAFMTTTTEESITTTSELPTTTTVPPETDMTSTPSVPTTSELPTTTTTLSAPTKTTKMPTKSTTTIPVPTTTTDFLFPSCPDGWLQYHISCYQLHLHDRVTHDTASRQCAIQNSHLLFINSAREQNVINGYLNESRYLANIGDHNLVRRSSVWTGGMRHAHQTEWRWVDPSTQTTLPLNYVRWENEFPHYDVDQADVCLGIVGIRQYLWHDFICTNKLFYICERSVFNMPSLVG